MKLPKKNLSTDAFCVNPHQTGVPALFLIRMTKVTKKKWCDSHDLYLGLMNDHERVFTPVNVKNQLYWMDCITGSLYGNTGRCESSSQLMLDLESLYHSPNDATDWLMDKTSEEAR